MFPKFEGEEIFYSQRQTSARSEGLGKINFEQIGTKRY